MNAKPTESKPTIIELRIIASLAVSAHGSTSALGIRRMADVQIGGKRMSTVKSEWTRNHLAREFPGSVRDAC
jgi:hypothetical protein